MTPELKTAILAFEDFLNEPPAYEELLRVREYRHEAYREWLKLRGQIDAALSLQDCGDGDDRMIKISKLIEDMQEVNRKFGDTCVYIRRGGLSWGAVALNRRDDDKKHGVFDLQAQHDRDMLARLEQIGRLKQSRDEWMEKTLAGPMVAEEQTEAKS